MANALHINDSRSVLAIATATDVATWRRHLPVLTGRLVTLRELKESDAAPLLALLYYEETHRFVARPPATAEEFRAFIAWTRRQQERACPRRLPSRSTATTRPSD